MRLTLVFLFSLIAWAGPVLAQSEDLDDTQSLTEDERIQNETVIIRRRCGAEVRDPEHRRYDKRHGQRRRQESRDDFTLGAEGTPNIPGAAGTPLAPGAENTPNIPGAGRIR